MIALVPSTNKTRKGVHDEETSHDNSGDDRVVCLNRSDRLSELPLRRLHVRQTVSLRKKMTPQAGEIPKGGPKGPPFLLGSRDSPPCGNPAACTQHTWIVDCEAQKPAQTTATKKDPTWWRGLFYCSQSWTTLELLYVRRRIWFLCLNWLLERVDLE